MKRVLGVTPNPYGAYAPVASSPNSPYESRDRRLANLYHLPYATLETSMAIFNSRSGLDMTWRVTGYAGMLITEILKKLGAPKSFYTHVDKGASSLLNARTLLRLVGLFETLEGIIAAHKIEDTFERKLSVWQNLLMFPYYSLDNIYCASEVMGLLPITQPNAYALSRGSSYFWGLYIVLDVILDHYRYRKAQAKYGKTLQECASMSDDCFTEEIGFDIQRKRRQASRQFRHGRRVWHLKTVANFADSFLAFHFAHPKYPLPASFVALCALVSTISGLILRSIRIRISIEQQKRRQQQR